MSLKRIGTVLVVKDGISLKNIIKKHIHLYFTAIKYL